MKKIVLCIIIFMIIGELMIRFDKSYAPMEENRIVKISTDIELTQEYNMIKNNSFIFNDNDQRIMVIGDSYIHGGGINFEDNFSQQLKKIVNERESDISKTWVLDVSKSSSNNLDNHQTYFSFVDKFKPNIVILGYNLNDIEGDLDNKNKEFVNTNNFKEIKGSGNKTKSPISKIYKAIKASNSIHFILSKFHRKLNDFGIIIPNSKFDISMRSYYENRSVWKKSKTLLQEIIQDSDENNIHLLVYKFTEMSENPELFAKANEAIDIYFRGFPSLIYIDGNDFFKAENAKEYRLSKYDGHPNEKAHKKMAEDVFNILIENGFLGNP